MRSVRGPRACFVAAPTGELGVVGGATQQLAEVERLVSPASHFVPQDELIRETLDWFDRYLGVPGG